MDGSGDYISQLVLSNNQVVFSVVPSEEELEHIQEMKRIDEMISRINDPDSDDDKD